MGTERCSHLRPAQIRADGVQALLEHPQQGALEEEAGLLDKEHHQKGEKKKPMLSVQLVSGSAPLLHQGKATVSG